MPKVYKRAWSISDISKYYPGNGTILTQLIRNAVTAHRTTDDYNNNTFSYSDIDEWLFMNTKGIVTKDKDELTGGMHVCFEHEADLALFKLSFE